MCFLLCILKQIVSQLISNKHQATQQYPSRNRCLNPNHLDKKITDNNNTMSSSNYIKNVAIIGVFAHSTYASSIHKC